MLVCVQLERHCTFWGMSQFKNIAGMLFLRPQKCSKPVCYGFKLATNDSNGLTDNILH